MIHRGMRALFAGGAAFAAIALGAAVVVALLPASALPFVPRDVPVAKLSTLPETIPMRVTSTDLVPLEDRARQLRSVDVPYAMMGSPKVESLPIYLIRSDGEVRAFIGLDPRNGCRLDTITDQRGTYQSSVLLFHDVCHGSLYDMNGDRYGGPTPWTLDQLVVSVRDGIVYVDRTAVVPGRLANRGRQGRSVLPSLTPFAQ